MLRPPFWRYPEVESVRSNDAALVAAKANGFHDFDVEALGKALGEWSLWESNMAMGSLDPSSLYYFVFYFFFIVIIIIIYLHIFDLNLDSDVV